MSNTNQQHPFNSASHRTSVCTLGVSALLLGAALSLSACGGNDHHEVKAVDKVDEAAELAQKNAPEAEVVVVEESTTTQPTGEDMATTEDMATAETATEDAADAEAIDADAELNSDAEVEEAAAQVGAGAELSASAGKELYEAKCKVCHETGLLEAPKFGNSADWAPRLTQDRETLVTHSAEGYKQMPAQAVGDVTKEQVAAAVDYMIEHSS